MVSELLSPSSTSAAELCLMINESESNSKERSRMQPGKLKNALTISTQELIAFITGDPLFR